MATTPDHDLDRLRAAYPDWSLWRSRRGVLCGATRRRHVSDAEWYGPSWMTLIEDDMPTLAQKLKRQAEIP